MSLLPPPPKTPEQALATAPTRNLGDELTDLDLTGRAESERLGLGETSDLAALVGQGQATQPSPPPTPAKAGRPDDELPADLGPYQPVSLLGRGGMGQVLAVVDPALNRELAMKVLLPSGLDEESRARFLDEAQMTAQLQHPGVVPVHEVGQLPDGRAYFTMQVVRGRTLRALVEAHHGAPHDPAGLFHLVSAYHQACETIAYAHGHGVIHRDLKPDNVMVGEFGEVRVLDWGLAKRIDTTDEPLSGQGIRTIRTSRADRGMHETHAGEIMGTPVFMSPEQARGQNDQLSRASDVFALGGMLFFILSGRAPFEGAHAMAVMMRVVGGLRTSLEGRHPIPRGLREICDRAMMQRAEDRYPDAGRLAHAVADWLSGTQQRERALQLVAEARAAEASLAPMTEALRRTEQIAEGCRLAVQGAQAGDDLAREALWAAEDDVEGARLALSKVQIRLEQLLHSALTQSADLVEARAGLARHYRGTHAEAEARQDRGTMLRTEALLREQAEALPPVHPERSRFLEYLAGEGILTLETDPPGASVRWTRYEAQGRRLVAVPERDLKPTPLRRQWLPQGSHLLIVRAPGRADVRYPVHMTRLGRWDGYGDAGENPGPVVLPAAETLGAGDVYVAAGTFVAGGDPAALDPEPRRAVFLPGFVITRTPVTNAEYLAFMNDLAMQGNAEAAMRFAPRIAGQAGFTWKADLPVVLIDRACAQAYARWLFQKTGLPWRLPTALEWEKAARGVDGRLYPWGDFHHAPWANLRDRNPTAPALASVEACPVDESPYGVRGMAGNVREWTADELPGRNGVQAVLKGGGYLDVAAAGRVAGRTCLSPDHRDGMTGFRLVRSL